MSSFYKFALLLLLLQIASITCENTQSYSLHYLQILARHGARVGLFPQFDPFKTDYGNLKTGELTKVGMRQHYLLGTEFNNRYNINNGTKFKLYDPLYNAYEVYAQSSQYHRTIQSLYYMLQGLFPPGIRESLSNAQVLSSVPPFPINNTLWYNLGNNVLLHNSQIVPIHNHQKKADLLKHDWCPRAAYQWVQREHDEYAMQIERKYQESGLLPKIGKILNMTYVSVQYAHKLRDDFEARINNGQELYEFEQLWNELKEMDFQQRFYSMTNNQKLLTALNNEYLRYTMDKFNTTIEYALRNETDSNQRLKLSVFAYHDNQMFQLGVPLGFNLTSWPPYASTILFELWHDDNMQIADCGGIIQNCYDQFYVEVIFNDEEITVPNYCENKGGKSGKQCRLDQWWKFVESKMFHADDEYHNVHQYCDRVLDQFTLKNSGHYFKEDH